MKTRVFNPFRSGISTILSVLTLGCFAAPSASAANRTWVGGYASSGSWSQALNWSEGAYANGSDVIFNDVAGVTPNTFLAGGKTVKSITYNGGATSPAFNIRLATTFNGGVAANLTFISGNTGITIASTDTASHIIGQSDGSVILQGNLPVTHNGTGILTIDRPINDTTSSFGLTKDGTGTMRLLGANTYDGATQVNGGILVIGNIAAYGTTSGVTAGAAGTIGLGVGGAGYYSSADVASLFSGTLAGYTMNATSGVAIDTSAVATFTQGVGNAYGGGNRSLTKLGTGTLQLNQTNTYSGATDIRQGTLSLGAGFDDGKLSTSSAITISSGATFAINRQNNVTQGTDFTSSAITGSGNFAQIGSGVTTLNAANSYTGTTTISGGMLKHEGSATLTAGNLILNGGGVLGLTSDFTRGRGTADNQVQWTGSGGFAAIGADRVVSLGGTNGTAQWASGSFVPSSSSLVLGHTAATHTVTFTNNINFATSGTRTIQVNDGAASVDAILSGTMGVSGGTNGGFIKTGLGTLKLTNNTSWYTGTTTVSNGTLIVNGNISTSSLTTVQTGATLGGSGTVGGLTIDLGGILAPGNSPGILNVNGAYTQNGTLSLELNGTVAGSQYDQVNVTGSVTLNGLLAATVGYVPAPNDLLFILLNDDAGADPITGTFTGLAQGDTVTLGGYDWKISYTANWTGAGGTFLGGNDVALMAVPEPRAALLGSLGLLALLRRRRA